MTQTFPTTWKLSFTTTKQAAEIYADTLEDALHPEATAISNMQEDEAHNVWRVEAYYLEEPDSETLRTLFVVPEELSGTRPQDLIVEELPPTDWVSKSQEGLHPIITERFFLHGSHDADKQPDGKIPLLVDAGMAFGTGHHPTTHGCLKMIEIVARRRQIHHPLDLGCGSGVLAIALAKLTGAKVIASDIDATSVEITRDNALLNGVGPRIKALTAAGFDHPTLREQSPFDLIIANILAGPLCDMAAHLSSQILYNGEIILSGILQEQANMVLSAYRMQGLYLKQRLDMEEWVTLNLAPRP